MHRSSSRVGILRLVQVAVVGSDHSSLGAVQEERRPARGRFDLLAKRANEVGAEDADVVAQDLWMNRVIDERGDCFALWAGCLDDAHPPIIKVGRIVVVGDFPLGFARGNLDGGRLKAVDRFVDGLGGFVADEVHVLEVACVPAVAVRECVAIGSAMRVGRADQNMIGRDAADFRTDAISQH